VDGLVAWLGDDRRAEPAAAFPRDPGAVDEAGLYSWWADDDGLEALSAPFGVRLPPLIYAGQTGATTTRAHTERVATLRAHIGGNHWTAATRVGPERQFLGRTVRPCLGR